MFRFSMPVILLAAVLWGGVATLGNLALAEEPQVNNSLQPTGEDFRVDNAVYAGDKKEPISESATIFHEGVVYDCMKSPAEVVVFDKLTKQFTLLNMESGIRAAQTASDVTKHLAWFESRLKAMVEKKPDSLIQFMAAPKFDERFDEATRRLTLASRLVNYSLTLSSDQNPAMAAQYREFSDWYARLNPLLTPGALPPFARLAVNDAVAKRKAIATQVALTITSPKDGRKQVIRSTHRIVRPLTAPDLAEVARIRKAMSEFRAVEFEKYRKGEAK